jgi:hypothetical protein
MSRQLINEYRAELDKLRQVSGSRRESVLREAFKDLLKRWGKGLDLSFIPEHDIVTAKGNRIYVDGALLHGLRVPFGYWEAKDADDKLDDEIADKFRKGYPRDNILFTDDHNAYVVGERGPEVFVPTSSGNIVSGAGGPARDVKIALTINAPAGAAPEMLARSSRQVARAVRSALVAVEN